MPRIVLGDARAVVLPEQLGNLLLLMYCINFFDWLLFVGSPDIRTVLPHQIRPTDRDTYTYDALPNSRYIRFLFI